MDEQSNLVKRICTECNLTPKQLARIIFRVATAFGWVTADTRVWLRVFDNLDTETKHAYIRETVQVSGYVRDDR